MIVTRGTFIDLAKTPRDNDLLPIFVAGFISVHHNNLSGLGSSVKRVFEELLNNCLISVSLLQDQVELNCIHFT